MMFNLHSAVSNHMIDAIQSVPNGQIGTYLKKIREITPKLERYTSALMVSFLSCPLWCL